AFGVDAVFRNLAIVDGRETNGGGLWLQKYARVELKEVLVADNQAINSGGGIFLTQGAEISLLNADITRNSAADYGGGIDSSNGVLIIRGSALHSNIAPYGGAEYVGMQRSDDSLSQNTD